jgi:hypothetical protein
VYNLRLNGRKEPVQFFACSDIEEGSVEIPAGPAKLFSIEAVLLDRQVVERLLEFRCVVRLSDIAAAARKQSRHQLGYFHDIAGFPWSEAAYRCSAMAIAKTTEDEKEETPIEDPLGEKNLMIIESRPCKSEATYLVFHP